MLDRMRPTTVALALIASSLSLVACGGGDDGPDASTSGSMDGGRVDGGGDVDGGDELPDAEPSDAPECAPGAMIEGCACESSGVTVCRGAGGIQCCHGAWQQFLDGPCWDIDGGAPPACDSGPELGCACDTEDETACRAFYQWRLVCRSGLWAEDDGHVCC